ncbi:unnamed protein product, partial [Allacma fusca]
DRNRDGTRIKYQSVAYTHKTRRDRNRRLLVNGQLQGFPTRDSSHISYKSNEPIKIKIYPPGSKTLEGQCNAYENQLR